MPKEVEQSKTFESIYNRTLSYNRGILRRLNIVDQDQEDILQEGYLKGFLSMDRLDPNYLPDKWFAIVITNTARDFLRKQNRKPKILSYNGIERNDGEGEIEEGIITGLSDSTEIEKEYIERESASEALGRLTREEQILFIARSEGASLKEVSEETGFTEGKIKAMGFRARKRMREGDH